MLAGAGAILVSILSGTGVASAHTFFVGSDPPDGAALGVSPRTVVLDFSSDVDPSLARVHLTDGAAHALPIAGLTADQARPTRLDIQLSSLPPEAYRLSFSVRDPDDLHETSGSIVFGVATVPNLKPARTTSRGPDPFEVALRWLARSGLALLLGALVVMLVVLPRALSKEAVCRLQRRLLGLALVGVGAAAAGDTALLCLQATRIGAFGPTFSLLISQSDFGRRWLIGVQVSGALCLILTWLRAQTERGRQVAVPTSLLAWPRPSSLGAPMVCLLAVGQAIAVGVSGHTGGATTPTPAGVALRAAHLVAVGAWIGALVALAVVLADLRRHPDLCGRGGRQALLRRFSAVAASGLAAVVITGLLLTGDEVSTVTALLTTWYGSILMLKLAVVAIVALVGLYHTRLIRHRTWLDKRLGRTIPFEALGGLMAIMLGAALGATSPARGPQFGRQPAARPSAITTTSADLVVRVSLEPNRPGRNLLAVDLFNTRRPAPAPIGQVVVRMRTTAGVDAGTVKFTKVSDSHWDGGAVNLAPGGLGLDVLVERTGLASVSELVPWTVNGPMLWHQPTVVSSAPVAPLAAGAAAAIALIALAAAAVSRRQGRQPGPRATTPLRTSVRDPCSIASSPARSQVDPPLHGRRGRPGRRNPLGDPSGVIDNGDRLAIGDDEGHRQLESPLDATR